MILPFHKQEKDQVSFLLTRELDRQREKRTSTLQSDTAKLQSFEAVAKYALNGKCRHEVIAKYFGDDLPKCNKSCDVCRYPLKVVFALSFTDIKFPKYRSKPNNSGLVVGTNI